MSATKKRKTSGWSGLELDITLSQLRRLRSQVIVEEAPESDDTFTDQLDDMIATLEPRVNNPLPLAFSAATLEKFKIIKQGVLYLRPDDELREAIVASRAVGSDRLWSHGHMCKHLSFISSSVMNTSETSSRLAIDAFFFRSTAMVPPSQKMIMMLENHISTVHPGVSQTDMVIDYTAIVAESTIAENYMRDPPQLTQRYGGEMSAFLATEAKASAITSPFEKYLPRVLFQLVACAKHLGKRHIRGALTTGFKWRFVAVDLDTDGDGATYWVSELIEWTTKRGPTSKERIVVETVPERDPALIAGILSSWISKSFVKFDGDEWFQMQHGGGGVS